MQLPDHGPKGFPLLGNLPQIVFDPLKFFTRTTQRYGDVVPIRMGVSKVLFVNRPELITQLIRDRNWVRSEESRIALRSFLGDGLLSLEGATHLRHRRLMAPAFHRQRFRDYGALMSDETYKEIARWKGSETRDMREDMTRLTFSIVAKALFSSDPDNTQEADEVGRALGEVLPWMMLGAAMAGISPWLPVMYPPAARASLKRLKKLVREIIARRRREGGDRGDLLSILLETRDEAGETLSDADICAESLTLLMAGHDTAASTMAWALYLVAQDPQLQAAMAEQILSVTGDSQTHVTPEMLPKLPLVRQVIDETLRMFPVVWIADRKPQRALPLGPYTIPEGRRVIFSMLVTQRDARFFPEPERFDPGRFSPERVGQIPEGAYLPFGAGVHMCIGNHFALMELQIILAALLQKFTFAALPGFKLRLNPALVLSPVGALPLVVNAREHKPSHEKQDRVASRPNV